MADLFDEFGLGGGAGGGGDLLDEFDIQTPATEKPGVLGTLKEGAKSTGRALASAVDSYSPGDGQRVVDRARAQQEAPKAESLERFNREIQEGRGEDDGFIDAVRNVGGAVIRNPGGVGHAIVEQLANAAPGLAGGWAGMKAGAVVGSAIPGVGTAGGAVIGGVAGMFLGNAAIETGHKAMGMADDGDFTPDEAGQARREGAIKGAVVTGVDVITLGVGRLVSSGLQRTVTGAMEGATRKTLIDRGIDVADQAAVARAVANPEIAAAVRTAQLGAITATDTLRKRVGEGATLLAMESVGEGVGEYLGELAATGEADITDAVLESVLSLGQSGIETAWNVRGARARNQVQPLPTDENPNPAPVERPDPAGGALSRAAAQLPSPEPVLGLPAPDPVMYADSDGVVQDTGPVVNVDGIMQPAPQARPAEIAGDRTIVGMEGQAPTGIQPNTIPAEEQRRIDRLAQPQIEQERADLIAAAHVNDVNSKIAEAMAERQALGEPEPSYPLPKGLELADKDGHGRWQVDVYRESVQALVGQLAKGGDVAYVRDAHDRITGRTPSINPSWWQNMDPSVKPGSIEQANRIVSKALVGGNLGPKQARFIAEMMNLVDEIRVDPQQAERNQAILRELEWAASGEAARNQQDFEQGAERDRGVSEQDDAELHAYLTGQTEPFRLSELTPEDNEAIDRELILLDDTTEATRQAGDINDGDLNGNYQRAGQVGSQVPAQQGLQDSGRGEAEGGGTVPAGETGFLEGTADQGLAEPAEPAVASAPAAPAQQDATGQQVPATPAIGKRGSNGYLQVNGKFITPHQDYGFVVRTDSGGVYRPDRTMYSFETEQAAAEFAKDLPRDLRGGIYDPANSASETADDKKPATPKSPEPAASPAAPIEDAGEKLGGARKDELRTVRERLDDMNDEAIASSKLSELWPKGEVDRIADPFHAAAYHAVRGLIPAKPRVAYRVKRWVDQVKAARGVLQELAGVGADASVAKMRETSPSLNILADQIELLMGIDRAHWSRVSDAKIRNGRYSQDGEMVPGSWVELKVDKRGKSFYGHESIASALPAIKSSLDNRSAPEKKQKFSIYTRTATGEVFVTAGADKERRPLKTFKSTSEARKYLDDQHDDLVAAWEAVKNRDNVTKADMRRSVNAERVGQDYRDGKDVTPQQFLDQFGFRGVEFGNWVKQGKGGKERQGILNDAYDAFMDLAGVIGVPPKALSLEGRLGVGFGSRGRGGSAAAHYEPGRMVINLTKTKGAGSLAHEWFHALDNYFSRKRAEPVSSQGASTIDEAYITYRPEAMLVNKKHPSMRMTRAELSRYQASHPDAPLYTEGSWERDASHPEGVRPEVEKAFAELVATLNASPMLQRSKVIDGNRSDGYWSRIIERGARSFETYVIARLADQGARNDYLANVQTLEEFSRDPGRYPYLTPDEQGPVNEAFDKLLSTIETRETDSGDVAMFRRTTGATTSALGRGDVEKIAAGLVTKAAVARRFVLTSWEQLPKAIKDTAAAQGARPGDIKAVHWRGKTYLVDRRFTDARDVERTIFHEYFAHYGLRQRYGKGLEKQMNRMLLRLGGVRGLQAMAESQGFNIDHYIEGAAQDASLTASQRGALLMDELLAHMAEATGTLKRALQEWYGAVRNWLRENGYAELAKLNAADLAYELRMARQAALEASEAGAGVPVFSRALKEGEVNAEVRALVEQYASGEGAPTEAQILDAVRGYQDTEQAYGGRAAWEQARNAGHTKLNYRQWVLVRTPAFKQWFGEWENGRRQTEREGQGNKPDTDRVDERPASRSEQAGVAGASEIAGGREVAGRDRRIPDVLIDPDTGEPRVFYHGTSDDVTAFDLNHPNRKDAGWLGRGVYVASDPRVANSYANLKGGDSYPNVMPLFVRSAGDIYAATLQEKQLGSRLTQEAIDQATAMLRQRGYDGASLTFGDGTIELVSFEPTNIKSATGNAATFDPDNADIRFRRTSRAADAVRSAAARFGPRPLDPNDPFAEENRRLREDDRSLWHKAKLQFRRQFSPGGLLPGSVFSEKVARDSNFQAVEFDIKHAVIALDRAVKADYGVSMDRLDERQSRILGEALAGKVAGSIPTDTKTAIVAMRQYIDALSGEYVDILRQQVRENLKDADPGLIETITGNMGQYVHRSYQAFDDPQWFKRVPIETVNAARQYLANGYQQQGESATEARRLADVAVNEILKNGTAYDSMESFIAEGKLGAKDLSVLTRRKEVAPQIRALLGEYADPRLNFTKSATKMARLIWNQRFLDRVREGGMGVFLFEGKDRPAGATTQIAGEQSDTYSPMNGLWTYPEVAQAFKDALGKEQMGDLYRTIVRLNGMVKYGKTVLSPTTAMRNWQSALFFSLANGHFDLSHMEKSWAAFREQVTNNPTGDDLAYLRKLKELGVVYDTPYAGEMADLLREARGDSAIESVMGALGAKRESIDKGLRGFRKVNQMAQGFYTFGDDFWKIIGYENEKANLIKAGIPEGEAETMAAERIRNTYPTYSMVGRGINWLRRFPLAGTFVSFPAEIVRTSANMLKLTASDLRSDNPGLQAIGRKRAAGMAMVSAGFYALSAMTAAAFGVDGDEEEALRDLAAPWQKNSTFLYAGRDDQGRLRYFDMSFLDPYGYWKRPLTAIMRDQPWEKTAASAIGDMLSPFLGTDITAGALFEVMANKKPTGGEVYSESGSPVDQTTAIANHLRKALQPGFMSNAERLVLASQGVRREGSGQPYDMRDEVVSLLGWRASTLDARTGLYYRAFEFTDGLSDARRTLNRTLRSANKVSDSDIRRSRDTAQRMHEQAFREMSRLVSAASESGMTRQQIIQTLRQSNISQANINALMTGRVPRMAISPQSQTGAVRQVRAMQGAEQAAEVSRRFQSARAMLREVAQ